MIYILVATLAINVLLLLICLYVMHKVRRIHLMGWEIKSTHRRNMNDLFTNLENLDKIYRDFGFARSLPNVGRFAASPDFLWHVGRHVQSRRCKNVLECSSGVSTIVLAQLMKQNGVGHVYSLEHASEYASMTRTNLKEQGLQDWATVIDAPLKDYVIDGQSYRWYDCDGKLPEAVFDCLVIDGPPEATCKLARYPAGPKLFPLLQIGSHVFLDDYYRRDEKEAVRSWKSSFPGAEIVELPFEKGCAEISLLHAVDLSDVNAFLGQVRSCLIDGIKSKDWERQGTTGNQASRS
jgi:hypothetical protein